MATFRSSIFLPPVYVLLLCVILCGWKHPDHYRDSEKASGARSLDYVVVELNGQDSIVKNDERITYVRGDTLRINKVVLVDAHLYAKTVNIVGFKGAKDGSTEDDLGYLIDTSIELTNKRWAVDDAGFLYAVMVVSEKLIHGSILLERMEPELSYIDVKINNENRVMREGQYLLVKGTDIFEISRVVTNIREQGRIQFNIIAAPSIDSPVAKKVKKFQIFISNKNYIFAKIPFFVESL